MKHGRTERDWAIVALMSFLAGALLVWALMAEQAGEPASPISSTEWAAWVQAIGSLAAIGVAIYVPWRQRQQQIRDSQQREKQEFERADQLLSVMHGALFHPIEQLRGNCELVLQFLEHPLDVRSTLPESVFDRAPEFDQFRSSLHLMGNTGIDVNIIISREDHLRLLLRVLRSHPTIESDFKAKARGALTKTHSMAVAVLPTLRERGLKKFAGGSHATGAV